MLCMGATLKDALQMSTPASHSRNLADVNDKKGSCLRTPFRNLCVGLLKNAIYISQQGREWIWEARQMAMATIVSNNRGLCIQAGILNLGTGRGWQGLLVGLLLLKSDTPKLMAVSSNCE